MTIHLPNDLESSIQAIVHSGRFASVDDAMAEAARLLLREIKQAPPSTASRLDALHRQMLADGLLSQLPNATDDIDDEQEAPVEIEGEPLSETIIRERR
jgi:Arc/MetJ-type ribon-helix-helix transcriptional regulator